jgi:excinuclease UvrABC nuclease subunit
VDEAIITALPDGPGVYVLRDGEGQVLYVGKSRHVRARVRDHLRGDCPGQPRLRKRLREITDVEAIETGSELEALFLESKLIKRYLPEANVVGRGWRNYPFLRIDLNEPFPRLEMTREPTGGDATLFGPLRRAAGVAAAADFLQDSLGLRRCKDEIRPGMSACPLLDLKKCLGPCVRPEARPAYGQAVEAALDLLEGRDTALLDAFARRRDELAEALRFEEAAALRDHIRELEYLLGDRRRLEAVARRNLVVVAPSKEPRCRELFFIRAGRLVDQRHLELPARSDRLRRALRACFAQSPPPGPIEREVVDEMRHLDGWLRRERAILRTVPVDPADPQAALPLLLAAVRGGRVHPIP